MDDTVWAIRGDSIQATFWELKREQVTEVCLFTSSCTAVQSGQNRCNRAVSNV